MIDVDGRHAAGQWLAGVVLALMSLGLVAIASASVSVGGSIFGSSIWSAPFVRQGLFAVLGFGVMVAVGWRVGPWVLASRKRRVWLFVSLAVLALVGLAALEVLGHVTRGSARWLRLSVGGMRLGVQPSELAKPALIGLLALFFTREGIDPRSFRRGFVPATAGILICCALVGSQDLGTAALLGVAGAAVMLVAGCRVRHLGLLALLGLLGFGVLVLAKPYRMERLLAYGDIWQDPQGRNYQAIQSLATIASGGWFGTGLGAGVQKYGYLPESRTDFIFSALCEEMGVVGGLGVIALFVLLAVLGIRVMLRARTQSDALLAFGLTMMLSLQAVMNLAVVTVSVPTTGISLPFVSAGGSGLIVACLVVGLLLAIEARGAAESVVDGTADLGEQDGGRAGVSGVVGWRM